MHQLQYTINGSIPQSVVVEIYQYSRVDDLDQNLELLETSIMYSCTYPGVDYMESRSQATTNDCETCQTD